MRPNILIRLPTLGFEPYLTRVRAPRILSTISSPCLISKTVFVVFGQPHSFVAYNV